jgi:hypothetical protein
MDAALLFDQDLGQCVLFMIEILSDTSTYIMYDKEIIPVPYHYFYFVFGRSLNNLRYPIIGYSTGTGTGISQRKKTTGSTGPVPVKYRYHTVVLPCLKISNEN